MKFELLRQFSGRFALFWVILPNICAIAMWPIGGPATGPAMVVSGVLAIGFCMSDRLWVRRIGIAFCLFVSTLFYVASSFNLDFDKALSSLVFLKELDVGTSPEYLAAGLVVGLALAAGLKFAGSVPRLARPGQKIMALAAVAILINVDVVATAGTNGSYHATPPPGRPIESAVLHNRIAPQTVSARHLVIIMVESLGVPNNDHDRALFDRAWGASRWSARYAVNSGTTAYFGSTTNAELRELCSAWADYGSFAFDKASCLPDRFRKAGFATTAMHTFTGSFFNREKWYPRIGFEHLLFMPELQALGASECAGLFDGLCDVDIPPMIGERLRQAGDKRQLIYWLTLNGHLPVPASKSINTQACSTGDADWDHERPPLCRTYQVNQQLADAIVREVMRPDFPDADILIVGDHMPPFFPRDIRSRFDTQHVPWIMLRNRKGATSSGA